MKKVKAREYNATEEKWNIITHGFGLILSLIGMVLLIVHSSLYEDAWHIVSFSVYGASMVVLYTASTVFHASKPGELRKKLNIFDHASIFFLIAGTYTPFTLVTLRGGWGWSLFGVVWGLAIAGIILKLFYTGRFEKISTAIYVVLGWIIIIAIKPLINAFPLEGLFWLGLGGISYSVGAVFFLWHKLPFNHAIFHVFVLVGSISHFLAVYFYV
jgi:hemolysin III